MGALDEFKNMNFDHVDENDEHARDIHEELMKTCKDSESGILKF